MPLPLEGYRVIDMTEVWAGPMGLSLLGDLGAEVIRIESYPRASMTRPVSLATANPQLRAAISPDNARPWDASPTYHLANRNKLGIALNVMHPLGRPVFERLVAVSDAVVVGFTAGTIHRMGIDHASLARIKPDITLLSMPGWGERGPYQGYATLGSGLDAFAAHHYLRGYPDLDPTSTSPAVFHSDATGALAVAFAVMTALHYRERTGKGQFIDLSQAEVLLTHLPRPLIDWSMNGRAAAPRGNSEPNAVPHGCYPTREAGKWAVIAVRNDAQWSALVGAMGSPAWANAPALASLLGRLKARETVDSGLREWTEGLDRDDLLRRLREASVPAAPVYSADEVLNDPQLRARGFFVEAEHPPVPAYKRADFLWRMSETPTVRRYDTNHLGEHNREVLCGLAGLSEGELEGLRHAGVIGDAYRPGAEVD